MVHMRVGDKSEIAINWVGRVERYRGAVLLHHDA
jgi:hypothetical protein